MYKNLYHHFHNLTKYHYSSNNSKNIIKLTSIELSGDIEEPTVASKKTESLILSFEMFVSLFKNILFIILILKKLIF